jgi:hypothetical protein
LARLQEVIQEHQEARPLSIATTESITMIETNLIISSSLDFSHDNFGEFEKYTRGIISKILWYMGCDGQGLGKRRQGILSPIIATPWVKHVGLCFDGIFENSMTM